MSDCKELTRLTNQLAAAKNKIIAAYLRKGIERHKRVCAVCNKPGAEQAPSGNGLDFPGAPTVEPDDLSALRAEVESLRAWAVTKGYEG